MLQQLLSLKKHLKLVLFRWWRTYGTLCDGGRMRGYKPFATNGAMTSSCLPITKVLSLKSVIITILFCCFVSGQSRAQGGYITTIAGNGVTQYIGDGYPATNLSLATPSGLCMDRQGNVYSTDFASHRIRKITPSDSIYTIGLTGVPGYTGDNGPATNATMDRPYGITIDTFGNLYIIDQRDDVVRKITRSTGIITTICGNGAGGFFGDGGPATAAHMEQPAGLCIDNAGNLYIADKGNNRIRKVDAATGIISTVAGLGTIGYSGDDSAATAAKLSNPLGVCLDIAGNIYIADYGNHRIRKVDAITGIITTFAGTGVAGNSGNGGPATNAQLTQPSGVFMSKQGNLYISDYGNNVIRIIGPDGVINKIACTGGYGYTGDHGPAQDATMIGPLAVFADDSENIFIADGTNSAIRKIQHSPVGIADVKKLGNLPVYPNPTTGACYIDAGRVSTNASVLVCNMLGAVVYSAPVMEVQHRIDMSGLPTGVYFVRLFSGNDVRVGKVVKE